MATASPPNKIDNAAELQHAILEYDSPRWHQRPLAFAVLGTRMLM
ncbi:hypothetical protein [Streptomyces capparidis]